MLTPDLLQRQFDRNCVEFKCDDCGKLVGPIVTRLTTMTMEVSCEHDVVKHIITTLTQRDASEVLSRVRAGTWTGQL